MISNSLNIVKSHGCFVKGLLLPCTRPAIRSDTLTFPICTGLIFRASTATTWSSPLTSSVQAISLKISNSTEDCNNTTAYRLQCKGNLNLLVDSWFLLKTYSRSIHSVSWVTCYWPNPEKHPRYFGRESCWDQLMTPPLCQELDCLDCQRGCWWVAWIPCPTLETRYTLKADIPLQSKERA